LKAGDDHEGNADAERDGKHDLRCPLDEGAAAMLEMVRHDEAPEVTGTNVC
jgi:hypothetical protein